MTKNKLIAGVGIMDADYSTRTCEYYVTHDGNRKRKTVWRCRIYSTWSDLIHRCYAEVSLTTHPTYSECYVCDEWLTFSNFKVWMDQQDYEGKQLDKDILIPGNKVYSPKTCVFVSGRTNRFILETNRNKGKLPVGITYSKKNNKFQAQCKDVITNKNKYLGYYSTPQEAHQAWLEFKLVQAYIIARDQSDERVAKALIDRYENYGDWNDTKTDAQTASINP